MTHIESALAGLPRMSRLQLLEKWRELYGQPAPHIRREIMIPFLAYRIQERAFGGLQLSTRAELRRIARTLEVPAGSGKPALETRTKPGTRLIRHWRGKIHEVLVTKLGFEHNETLYKSLSPIARKITGTSWSGPAFFGLRKQSPSSIQTDD